ncbi:uncharacterized protein BN903_41 [Halorubrum sp. AJ67]|nr:hypothetical protein [Halorubrum sp. AJ67]CDK37841.1 uncharacterized protein BN903_41 [Halorubrum sp. AJ67]
MSCEKRRVFGAGFVLLQGVVTAVFPQLSVKLAKKMIGKNFDNASDLEANPAYVRQLRAVGVGMVAAGGTTLLLDSPQETKSDSPEDGASDEGSTESST